MLMKHPLTLILTVTRSNLNLIKEERKQQYKRVKQIGVDDSDLGDNKLKDAREAIINELFDEDDETEVAPQINDNRYTVDVDFSESEVL